MDFSIEENMALNIMVYLITVNTYNIAYNPIKIK